MIDAEPIGVDAKSSYVGRTVATVMLEIRTYRCMPGRRDDFLNVMRHRSIPLLATYGIRVVDFGPPLVDEEPWEEAYLMRAFNARMR